MKAKTIILGIKWTSIQFAFDTLFRFALKLILAKLLAPNEFGLVGMCTVFISIASAASQLGMGAALIQKKNDSEAEQMYSTAFWTGIIWGSIVYLLVAIILGPFIASFYKESELIKLMPVLSLGLLIKPIGLIHEVVLTRSMQFKKLAKIYNFSALLAGIVAVILAYYNFGVWALVINNTLGILLSIPLLFMTVSWKPKWNWNKTYFNNIFGFGVYSTGTQVFSNFTYQLDNFIIGKMLGASTLGAYTLSFSLTENLRIIISGIMNKVMYPVFGRSQDEKEKLKSLFYSVIKFNAIIIYPIMVFLIIFGDEIVLGCFGNKWGQAIIPLKILALAVLLHLFVNSFTSLIRGVGRPDLEMKIIVGLTTFVLAPGLFLGIKFFGLIGASIAVLVNKFFLVATGMYILKKELKISPKKMLIMVKSAFFGTLISSFVVLFLDYFVNVENAIIKMSLFLITYSFSIFYMEHEWILYMYRKLKSNG